MESDDARPRVWFKNGTYYILAYLIWGAVLTFLQPVGTEQMAGTSFWGVKVQQAVLGAGFGAICGVAFTVLQNGLNQARRKWVSWVLAIGTWVMISAVLTLAMR